MKMAVARASRREERGSNLDATSRLASCRGALCGRPSCRGALCGRPSCGRPRRGAPTDCEESWNFYRKHRDTIFSAAPCLCGQVQSGAFRYWVQLEVESIDAVFNSLASCGES